MGCNQLQEMSAGKGMQGITQQHDISHSDKYFDQYLLEFSLLFD